MNLDPLIGERLHAAVRRVLEEVPFYAGSPRPTGSDWFSSLPVLRRDALLGVEPSRWVTPEIDLASALAAGKFRPLTTSGSTDEPLKVYADLEVPLPPNVWSMHGLSDDSRLANLTAPVCLGTSCPGDVAPHGSNGLLLTFRSGLFEAGDAAIHRAVQAFNEFAPAIAFVNPVWLHWLVRRAVSLGLSLHQPDLICLTYQYPSRCQRRALAQAFTAPQVEFYGASEFGGTDLAIGCPAGHLHLVEYQAYAEALPSEHPGHEELVFSTPLSRTMPLLRYAPGDLGRVSQVDEGSCALWDVPVLELDGRVHDVMLAEGRFVSTRAFDEAVGTIEDLEFYEARCRDGLVSMRCIVVPGSADRVQAALRQQVHALGFARLTFTAVERLSLSAGGKLQLTGEDERNVLEAR